MAFAGNQVGQPAFVLGFRQAEGAVELGFVGQLTQGAQLVQVAPPGGANPAVNQGRQWPVGLRQPPAGRDAVGLVAKPLWKDAGKVGEDGLDHQLAVQRRDAVDLVAGQHRDVGHAHATLATFVNQRYTAQQVVVIRELRMHLRQEAGVQVVNDAQVARQQTSQQVNGPGFQRFLHQCVVGVAEDALAQ